MVEPAQLRTPYAALYSLAAIDRGQGYAPDFRAIYAGQACMGPGQYGPSVVQLQVLLAALGYFGQPSGNYCGLTESAVHQFQGARTMPPGFVDARTLRSLEQAVQMSRQSAPRAVTAAPTPEVLRSAPEGTIKAALLENRERFERREGPVEAAAIVAPPEPIPVVDSSSPVVGGTNPPAGPLNAQELRQKKERLADKNLAFAERELRSTKNELQDRGVLDRMFLPEETKARAKKLEDQVLPELRTTREEYQTSKRLGAPEAEVDAKLERYLSASIGARETIRGSLKKEGQQGEDAIRNIDTSMKVTKTVRDVAATSAVAIASGGTSVAVTGGLVAGGAVLKTASDEASKRQLGEGSTAGEIAGSLVKNTAGLTVDAAGGAGLKVLGGATKGATFVAGAAGVGTATGAAKRGINGEEILDGKAMLSDAVGGGLTAGVGTAAAPAIAKLGEGGKLAAQAAIGASTGAGAQVGSNAIHGRELSEGVVEATITGGGAGLVMGAAMPKAAAQPKPPVAEAKPPPLPVIAEAKPPVIAEAKPPVIAEAKPPPLPATARVSTPAQRYIDERASQAFNDAATRVFKQHGIEAEGSVLGTAAERKIPAKIRKEAERAGTQSMEEEIALRSKEANPLGRGADEAEAKAQKQVFDDAARTDRRVLLARDADGNYDLAKLPKSLREAGTQAADEGRADFLANYGAGRDRPPLLPGKQAPILEQAADRWAADQANRAYDGAQERVLRAAVKNGEIKSPALPAKLVKAGDEALAKTAPKIEDPMKGFMEAADRAELRGFQRELERAAQKSRRLLPLARGAKPTPETLEQLPPELRDAAVAAGAKARRDFIEPYWPKPEVAVPPQLPEAQPATFSEALRRMNQKAFGLDIAPTLDPSKMADNFVKTFLWPFALRNRV